MEYKTINKPDSTRLEVEAEILLKADLELLTKGNLPAWTQIEILERIFKREFKTDKESKMFADHWKDFAVMVWDNKICNVYKPGLLVRFYLENLFGDTI